MDLKELGSSLSPLERRLLPHLENARTISSLVASSGLQEVEVRRSLMWLANRGIVKTEPLAVKKVILLKNGLIAKEHGLPELRILKKLLQGPLSVAELVEETLPQQEIIGSLGILKSQQLVKIQKIENGLQLEITVAGKVLAEQNVYAPAIFFTNKDFPCHYDALSSEEKLLVQNLAKRKDFLKIEQRSEVKIELLDLGKQLIQAKLDFSHLEEQLTSEMLRDGSWQGKEFRVYDVKSPVPEIAGGRRHPLREATNIIRDIYLQMGFTEMSGPWVETAFWCMDSMWIPQDHPARDVQDTFFLSQEGDLPAPELVDKVRQAHENGLNTGSTGYQKKWDPKLAKQLLLRTHSTATSFRTLAKHGNKDGKYFYVANVFRNEAVDTTHLAEFIQAEGFVIGDNLTLADLMGFIKEFYARLGITKIRFKPTYNPYTEPSLEAHYYDEEKKKWYALINSGIFRPESLAPYGITKTVIAWGMGASRVAALLTKKNNLRELVGPTVSFDWIAKHKTPQPRLD